MIVLEINSPQKVIRTYIIPIKLFNNCEIPRYKCKEDKK